MPLSEPKRLKVAIYDLTDCEGCELQFINMREALLLALDHIEIVNWRLAGIQSRSRYYDAVFIEGTPLSAEEISELKALRSRSGYLVALGSCACLGGVQASLTKKQTGRSRSSIPEAHPLSHYVNVDHHLNGCPVTVENLTRVMTELIYGKRPSNRQYPVCLDCKVAGNTCVLLKGEPCLGPLTLGSCHAICVTQGQLCFGCNGPVQDANFRAYRRSMKEHGHNKASIDRRLDLFMMRVRGEKGRDH